MKVSFPKTLLPDTGSFRPTTTHSPQRLPEWLRLLSRLVGRLRGLQFPRAVREYPRLPSRRVRLPDLPRRVLRHLSA